MIKPIYSYEILTVSHLECAQYIAGIMNEASGQSYRTRATETFKFTYEPRTVGAVVLADSLDKVETDVLERLQAFASGIAHAWVDRYAKAGPDKV